MKLHLAAVASLMALATAGSAHAQCPYQSTLLGAFDATGNPQLGDEQNPANGWTFRRTNPDGLLKGATLPSLVAPGWGDVTQPFSLPFVGPRYSPAIIRNQVGYLHRAPTFEGLFFHPGYGSIDVVAQLAPQAPVKLNALSLFVEKLGSISPNAIISARLETTAGSITLIPPTTVTALADSLFLQPASGLLPLTLSPTQKLFVIGNNGGAPEEDWLNLNIVAELDGPPLIATQPRDARVCSGASATLRTVGVGVRTYTWRRNTVVVQSGLSATYTIPSAGPGDVAVYDCIVSNNCGSVTSAPVTLLICLADLNCDGLVDFSDYLDFLNRYDSSDPSVDFNQDGLVDFSDYLEFLNYFDAGC